ncbi:hypothetical protein [Pedobacter sp. L105]|uniref:hypothetical protein n=1 Tax=Pedobacter sp. L105 TaxID=1641871 RepID=UPI00131C60B1|nr:hypothetical protein [Pedobacter sp. L105]
MKTYKIIAGLFLLALLNVSFSAFSQDSIAIYRIHGKNLPLDPGSSIITDVTAQGGVAIFRSASAPSGTFWYGPYKHFLGGNYLIQFRMKVASNLSNLPLLNLDVFSISNGLEYGVITIKPSDFRISNGWQLFTIAVQIPDNVPDIELRGTSFFSGITDVSMDNVTILPGDVRGLYSNEFTITGTGKVGIGTVDPKGYSLAVNGNIHTKEVNVDVNGWADYVFKNEYSLLPLSEVKTYIDKNQHLPDMPSESELVKSGLNVGEMNKILTKKVEELTLYLIENQKELQELKNQMNQFIQENKKNK